MIQNKKQFSINLQSFLEKVGIDSNIVIRKVALQANTSLIRKTPVDTGIARSGWTIGVNKFPSKDDKSGIAGLSSPLPIQKVIIANYVPYIKKLEAGSSTQAPSGMVKITLQEIGNSF